MTRSVYIVTVISTIFLSGAYVSAGEMIGSDAEQQFSAWITSYGGTFLNFDELASGTLLDDEYSSRGVTFASIRDPSGSAISKPVVVIDYGGSREISGTPSWGSGSDGRVAYQIRFSSPQKWAGIARHWNNYYTITRFYTPAGTLIHSFQGFQSESGFSKTFLAYVVDSADTNQWISIIECDGNLVDDNRLVGYSDNLYFGTANAVAKSSTTTTSASLTTTSTAPAVTTSTTTEFSETTTTVKIPTESTSTSSAPISTTSTVAQNSTTTTSIMQGSEGSGDVNADGDITSIDAALALQIVQNSINLSPVKRSAADVNNDGSVTAADADIILQWAAQGAGLNPPPFFTDIVDMPVVESVSGSLGSQGGSVVLESGISITVPAGRFSSDTAITLRKVDPKEIDPVGDKMCFQIIPDISPLAGSVFKASISTILTKSQSVSDIEGVAALFYNSISRRHEMIIVDHEISGETLSIKLDQIGAGGSIRNDQNSKLYIFIVTGAYASQEKARSAGNGTLKYQAGAGKTCQNVPYYEQGKSGYCWAASTAMAVNYYRTKIYEKPWDAVGALTDGYEIFEGITTPSFYAGHKYRDYIYNATGIYPERCFWLNTDSLKNYIISQIDQGRPVIVFLCGEKHVATFVGYRFDNGKLIMRVHDPLPPQTMYRERLWDDIASAGSPVPFFTAVVPGVPFYTEGISISILGHKQDKVDSEPEGKGFILSSPMHRAYDFPGGNIVFSWYTKKTGSYGFKSSNGMGLELDSIPNYYGMNIKLRVANTSDDLKKIKIIWDLKTLGAEGGETVYSGNYVNDAVNNMITHTINQRPVFVLQQDNFKDLDGYYLLTISASDPETGEDYDRIQLNIKFNRGIQAQAAIANDAQSPGKKELKLRWNKIDGDVDGYRVYKKTGAGEWKYIAVRSLQEEPEYVERPYDGKKETLYAVAACKYAASDAPLFFITSDAVSAKEEDRVVWVKDIPALGASVHNKKLYVAGGSTLSCFTADQKADQLWATDIGVAGADSTPAVVDGSAYIQNDDKALYSIDAQTGNVFWKKENSATSPVAVSGGALFVGGYDTGEDGMSYFYGLNAQTGDKKWKFSTISYNNKEEMFFNFFDSAAVSNDSVFLAVDSRLLCIDSASGIGKWLFDPWEVNYKYHLTGTPVVKDTAVYVAGTDLEATHQVIFCIDAATKTIKWTYKAGLAIDPIFNNPNMINVPELSLSGDKLYVAQSHENKLYCLNTANGQEEWTFAGGKVMTYPAVGSYVYAGSYDGKVYCINPQTGSKMWEFDPPETGTLIDYTRVLALADGFVYVSSIAVNKDALTPVVRLYCLRAEQGDIGSWPMYKYNPERTGAR